MSQWPWVFLANNAFIKLRSSCPCTGCFYEQVLFQKKVFYVNMSQNRQNSWDFEQIKLQENTDYQIIPRRMISLYHTVMMVGTLSELINTFFFSFSFWRGLDEPTAVWFQEPGRKSLEGSISEGQIASPANLIRMH